MFLLNVFVSLEGTNEFQVWGLSCVEGKRHTELKGYGEYQNWIEDKKKIIEIEVRKPG